MVAKVVTHRQPRALRLSWEGDEAPTWGVAPAPPGCCQETFQVLPVTATARQTGDARAVIATAIRTTPLASIVSCAAHPTLVARVGVGIAASVGAAALTVRGAPLRIAIVDRFGTDDVGAGVRATVDGPGASIPGGRALVAARVRKDTLAVDTGDVGASRTAAVAILQSVPRNIDRHARTATEITAVPRALTLAVVFLLAGAVTAASTMPLAPGLDSVVLKDTEYATQAQPGEHAKQAASGAARADHLVKAVKRRSVDRRRSSQKRSDW